MIVVDVETTGLDPSKHSIVSIGAIDFSTPMNRFYRECQIWNGAQVMQEALEINGFSEQEIRKPNKATVGEVIEDFLGWAERIKDRTIAGQNPSFDRDFLRDSARRYGIRWVLGHRTVDLHSICYAHHLERGLVPPIKNGMTALNLHRILNYVGLPNEPRPHNALTGANMEAEALSRLILGKALLEEFESSPIPDYLL